MRLPKAGMTSIRDYIACMDRSVGSIPLRLMAVAREYDWSIKYYIVHNVFTEKKKKEWHIGRIIHFQKSLFILQSYIGCRHTLLIGYCMFMSANIVWPYEGLEIYQNQHL